MDLESVQNNALTKLPLLKQGDYDTWRLRIESYIQLQDYALWEFIEDGNSFKPVAQPTTNADGTSTSTIPGVHLLTFNQYKDAKTLFEAIEARFGDNEATRKTQKTLLKQMYKNFNASSLESLDSIFTQLQKIISQLAILGENISQEDLNFKFLRSLPSEWSMHVVVWRNISDLGSISFDDLYNNFKIVEQEVKRSINSSSNSNSQNVAFVLAPRSTNDVNTSNVHVSTASSTDNTARLSDATIYAFLANQPNGSQVVHEDLEQIHEDDLEEMNLKWKLALLKSSSKAMLAIDGAGFDWSFMIEEEVPTNFDLMAFSDSELNKYEFDLANYKRGLAYVEEQLVFYKKSEGMLCDQIVVLKRDALFNELEINALKIQIERLKKEKKNWVSDCDEDETLEKVSESANV
ncbi:hypothetical protein Tco_1410932, partial [Tanacetum coccineum]